MLAGVAGLATSLLTAALLGLRGNPVTDVAELVVRLTPGNVAEDAIQLVGHKDKPLLVTGVLVILLLLFAAFGVLAQALARRRGRGLRRPGCDRADRGAVAVRRPGQRGPADRGRAVHLARLPGRAHRAAAASSRSATPTRSGASCSRRPGVGLGSLVVGVLGWKAGAHRRAVDAARSSLRLTGVTSPPVPKGAEVGLSGIESWQTPVNRFYRIDTSFDPPSILPQDWTLRIHGMVDHEITLTYADLLKRQRSEMWMTLNCVSNPVGGDLIGNAWWSGVRLKDLLAEAGVQAGADAVKQTSDDGWTCGTPLSALTDDRGAMLAIAINGQPLPIEHGFPVRTLVPGLYGYVSACKWVRELEVTTFDSFTAYWTSRGWSEQGPVKLASRIDVPNDGDQVDAGRVRVGGSAWQQHTGIKARGGAARRRRLAAGHPRPPVARRTRWVQWDATLDVAVRRPPAPGARHQRRR